MNIKMKIAIAVILGLILIVFAPSAQRAVMVMRDNVLSKNFLDYHTIKEYSSGLSEKYEIVEIDAPKSRKHLDDDITPYMSSNGSIVLLSNYDSLYRIEIPNVFDGALLPQTDNSAQELRSMECQVFESSFGFIEGSIHALATESFRPVRFLHREYNRKSIFSFGSISHAAYWDGIGIVDLVLKADTLKLRIYMKKSNSTGSLFTYPDDRLFYDLNFDFYILRPNSAYIYLIKPR